MELPRDIQLAIMRKLDLDTRRKIGLFCKLDIPLHIKRAITKSLNNRPKIKNIENIQAVQAVLFLQNKYIFVRSLYKTHVDSYVIYADSEAFSYDMSSWS